MFSKLLRDQSGRMVEPLLFVVIVGIAAAIIVPQLLARREARDQVLSAQCIKNLFLIKEGADPSALACPISDLAYESETRDGVRVLSCADPGNHLRFDLSLVQRGESWELHSRLPDVRPPPDGVVEIEGARTFLEYRPEEVTIVNPPPPPLERYLFIPLIVGILFFIFLMPAKWLGSALLSGYAENTIGQSLFLFVIFLLLLAPGTVFIAWRIHDAIHREEIVLSREDKSLSIKVYDLGRAFRETEQIPSVRGVFPVFVDDRYRVVAIYQDQGQMRHRTLFKSSGSGWEVSSLLNQLFAAGAE